MVSHKEKLSKGDVEKSKKTLSLLGKNGNYEYDQKIAALMSAVMAWSYADLDDFKRMLSDNPLINMSEADFMQVSANNDSLLIVATAQIIRSSDKKTAIICFRGTEATNPVNWMTDINSKKVPYLDEEKKIKVHKGFLANFRAVWDGVEGILGHLKDPCKISCDHNPEESHSAGEDVELESIYITGHSLGGAMAFLAGIYLSYLNHKNPSDTMWSKVKGIYTYGQPMVIDPSSADFCNTLIGNRLFRHVYWNDAVPHVPPVTMGLYAHIGDEYRYRPYPWHGWKKIGWGKVTQMIVGLPTVPFMLWDAIGHSVLFPFNLAKSPWSLMDHLPAGYMNTLNGITKRDVRGIMMFGYGEADEDVEDVMTATPAITSS